MLRLPWHREFDILYEDRLDIPELPAKVVAVVLLFIVISVPGLDVLLTQVDVLAEVGNSPLLIVGVRVYLYLVVPFNVGKPPTTDELEEGGFICSTLPLESSIAAAELSVLLCPTLIMSDEDQSNL